MRGLFLAAALLAAEAARGEDGPFDTPGHPVTADAAPPRHGEAAAPLPLTIRTYRAASRFQGPRCPHRPSCSAYASQAIHRHGRILGSFIGAARLLRGARSSAVRPLPRTADRGLVDPVEASTFFLEEAPR